MVQFRHRSLRLLAMLLIAGVASSIASAAEPIGSARLVVPDVSARSATETRRLAAEDSVAYQDLIATQRDAAAVIQFIDGTELAVGEQAEVRLDAFVFDPGAAGALSLSLQQGALRFATGSMRKEAYRITTPGASLAIRGTVFDLAVVEDGTTHLRVLEGAVVLTGANGETKEVSVGQSLSVSATGVPGAPAAIAQGTLASKIGKMDAMLADALPESPSAALASLEVLSKARDLRSKSRDRTGRPGDRPGRDKKGGKF